MKLHYSQTAQTKLPTTTAVLVPYEITLLSNASDNFLSLSEVLVPYEITLLSNNPVLCTYATVVLVPYEITLLSNKEWRISEEEVF